MRTKFSINVIFSSDAFTDPEELRDFLKEAWADPETGDTIEDLTVTKVTE